MSGKNPLEGTVSQGPADYITSADREWVYLQIIQDRRPVVVVKLSHEEAASLSKDLIAPGEGPPGMAGPIGLSIREEGT